MTTARKDGSLMPSHNCATEAGLGHVDLIGCGPGDPELLTLKAVKCLQAADVVITDRLVSAEIIAMAAPKALRIEVGKTPYQPSIGQDEINRIILREALKGKRVARLKGGDPGIFGRLAEEVSALRAAGVSVDIVPGITAAHACAAEIGLPVTLRQTVRQFSVLTGATADGSVAHDWHALVQPDQAFAIYMGIKGAGVLAKQLLAHGAKPAHPVVIVENGSRSDQRAVKTTLADLAAAIKHLNINGPAVIFVGLDWVQANLTPPEWVEIFDLCREGDSVQSDNHRNRSTQQPEVNTIATKAPV